MSDILFYKSSNTSRGGLAVGLQILSIQSVIDGEFSVNRYGRVGGYMRHIKDMTLDEFIEVFPEYDLALEMSKKLAVSVKIKEHFVPREKPKLIPSNLIVRGTVFKDDAKYPSVLLYLGKVKYTVDGKIEEGHGYSRGDSFHDVLNRNVLVYKTKKKAVSIEGEVDTLTIENHYSKVTKSWSGRIYNIELELL